MLRDVNRSGEMEVFVAVVEAGSFSEAARRLNMSPSAVSKLMARLEARLGTRLLNRSTRSIDLTTEGERFHRESLCILEQMTALEEGLLHETPQPTGDVRVNMNLPFGLQCVLDLLPGFLASYPGIRLSVDLTDHVWILSSIMRMSLFGLAPCGIQAFCSANSWKRILSPWPLRPIWRSTACLKR